MRHALLPASPADLLQWGHAFDRVEIDFFREFAIASHLLQWGHAFDRVEIAPVEPKSDAEEGVLQWGHAFDRVEITATINDADGFVALQWGHAFDRVEIATIGADAMEWAISFNGATLLIAWK